MNIAVQMIGTGGIDMLKVVSQPPEEPLPGTVRIRQEAIGVNFIDIYHRKGIYPLSAPHTLGVEGAGIVEAIGEGVTEFSIGERVGYVGAPVGAYATTRLMPVQRLIPLPDSLSSRVAAASLLRGLTAHMLLTKTYRVDAQSTLLIHAAAGGLGTLLVRWAKHLGARVIGTTSSTQKGELARINGADHVIVGRDADVVAEVASLTEGQGVDFAINGIGGDSLRNTFACVGRFGTVASIGQAAGPIPAIEVSELGLVRSLSLARPSVMAYSADAALYTSAVEGLLNAMGAGIVADIGHEYALVDAANAHADLEAGRSTGSLLLIP